MKIDCIFHWIEYDGGLWRGWRIPVSGIRHDRHSTFDVLPAPCPATHMRWPLTWLKNTGKWYQTWQTFHIWCAASPVPCDTHAVASDVAEEYRKVVSDMTDIRHLMCCQPRALRHTCGGLWHCWRIPESGIRHDRHSTFDVLPAPCPATHMRWPLTWLKNTGKWYQTWQTFHIWCAASPVPCDTHAVASDVAEVYRKVVSHMTDIRHLMCCQPRALRHTCGGLWRGWRIPESGITHDRHSTFDVLPAPCPVTHAVASDVAEEYRKVVSDMTDIPHFMCCQPRALWHTCGGLWHCWRIPVSGITHDRHSTFHVLPAPCPVTHMRWPLTWLKNTGKWYQTWQTFHISCAASPVPCDTCGVMALDTG